MYTESKLEKVRVFDPLELSNKPRVRNAMTNKRSVSFSLVVTLAALLSACGDSDQQTTSQDLQLSDTATDLLQTAKNSVLEPDGSTTVAVDGASEIPYPVYPNGSKYRVGGEHGLKIVVFETQDTFEEVDKFYKTAAEPSTMPRLVAMNDYVRYSSNANDQDPWATYRPGIVIHQFNDESERSAVGAKSDSRTNIIMSY